MQTTDFRHSAKAPPQRAGIGLRARHHAEIVASRPDVGWLEIHAENYMGGGAALHHLQAARARWPVSVHGVGLSLGSAAGLDAAHVARLARLVDRIEPLFVSEHLSWSGLPGLYLNDLLPLPYTEEALGIVAANIDRVQTALHRQILIENPSVYLGFEHSPMTESEFLIELARRTGCALLLDVNNIFVSAINLGDDPRSLLAGFAGAPVREIHLAGHTAKEIDGVPLLIDDHGGPVSDSVWSLYDAAIGLFPEAATLIEWDSNIPELDVLVAEAARADARRQVIQTGGVHARAL